jgi:hypothetical protein
MFLWGIYGQIWAVLWAEFVSGRWEIPYPLTLEKRI